MDIRKEVLLAYERIRPHIRQTPLELSPFYSQSAEAQVYFKLENIQLTGSFKLRGAMNKLLSVTEEERRRGVVTASTGNHGAAVAYSLNKLKAPGIIFVNQGADPSKVEAIRRMGGEVRFFGQDCTETETHARQYAFENHRTYVSPYNDPQVIGGQGTIGKELAEQIDRFDAIFVSVGGGGMIAGIAGYLKSVNPKVKIMGCSPENSQVMVQSVKAGKILDLPSLPTLSDGTAGGIEAGAMTFELCRDLVDEFVTVTEDEIKDTLRRFMHVHHMLIEGAAAVALASFLKMGKRLKKQNVVVVICGANIDLQKLKEIL
jgi:threonine dehydratase